MNVDQARGAAIEAQLSPRRDAVEAIERTGFLRTLGGVEAYVATLARVPKFHATDLDAALADRRVSVIPAVRGCMYVVAKRDVPYALKLAGMLAGKAAERTNAKAGVKNGELEKLGGRIVALLEKQGALSTDAIRKALPDAVRSLGEKGKKAGLSSTLPPALDLLEWSGHIDRMPESGRLDSQRYVWRATRAKSLDAPGEIGELLSYMARIFLEGAAFGTPKDFAAWAGVSQRDAMSAFVSIGAKEIEGYGWARGMQSAEKSDACALLPFEDNLVAYHGGPALLTDPQFHSMPVPQWGSTAKSALAAARHLSCRPVIADGKLAGFWEWDPKAKEPVIGLFDTISASAKRALDERADALARLLRDEVGHGRSFSLDTDEECAKRAAWVGKLRPKAARKPAGKRARA